ncbi:MAG: hypothetical protein IIA48_10475 [Bacteroidetes bacterium]|nr:hypothetical protein [Bacteroidota bacterium]
MKLMIASLAYSNDGTVESPLSSYQPPKPIQELVSVGQLDIKTGDEIINRSFEEFNNHSLIQRTNLDQKDWLAWSDAPSQNPDESWMFTGTSGATRNKIISTAAHLTSQVIYPGVFAQNDDDEEDEGAAYVMKNAIEYNCRRNNYEQTFLYAVISGLVNPVSYFEVDYCQGFQEVLEGTSSAFKRQQVVDDVLSGFQHALLPPDEVLLANPYIFDIQKQPFVIKRRRIPYTQAKALYGHLVDFMHVRPGVLTLINPSNNLFYDVDDEQDGLVEIAIPSYRGRDLQFPMVNRIYLGNPNADFNPMKHRTNKNKPKYNLVKFGAEPIDAMRFAYFKSLASKLSNDKELVDRMRQNAVDASTFATFPSIFTMGAGKLDKSVFIPATTIDLPKDAKVQPATGLANPQFAFEAARMAEQDVNNASLDPRTEGSRSGPETARGAIILQQNAVTNLGVMVNMIATMIQQAGELEVDDILRYQTVGESMQLAGGALGMKYMSMILDNKMVNGVKKTIVIRFTDRWVGKRLSEEEIKRMEVALYEEAGDARELHEVNPAIWAKRQFLIVIEPDILLPKNEAFERAIRLETYDRAINNPLIAADPEKMAEVTRDFLFEPTVKGEGAKYLPKDPKKSLQGILPPPRKGVAGRVVENAAVGEVNLTT